VKWLVLALVALLNFRTSAAQSPIELKRADLLRTEQGSAGAIRYLDGNVWIVQDTLSITGDHAIYDEAAGTILFTGNVHFVEPTRQFWSDRATYYERDGRAVGDGQVRIEQDSILIFCDRAVYHEARRQVNLVGNVRLNSLKDNAILTGNLGTYDRETEHGAMTQDPRLIKRFSETDSMEVTGNIIEYYFQDRQAVVTESVHLWRQDFDAWGQKLVYQDSTEWAQLTGEPVLRRGRDVMQADTVEALFQDEKIRRVLLFGQALATAPVDSLLPEPINRITGRRMELTFRDGQLDSMHVQGNATSLYYVREEEGSEGANQVSGDRMDLWMQSGRIRWIKVQGGTEGNYYPQPLERLIQTDNAAQAIGRQGDPSH
jgi:lipopolysaccharide export system protein LptA